MDLLHCGAELKTVHVEFVFFEPLLANCLLLLLRQGFIDRLALGLATLGRLLVAESDDEHRVLGARPALSLVVVGQSVPLDEVDPVVDALVNKVSQVRVHNELKAKDDPLQLRLAVDLHVVFKEVIVFLEFVGDLTNQKLAPPMHNVERSRLVVGLLLLLHVGKLVGKLEH